MCLIKLIGILHKRGISADEMYNACDVDENSRVTFDEAQKFIEGLDAGF